MSHEDLMDCIDPIRTPAEQQISALQREIASLKARLVEYPDRATLTETLAASRAEVARLTDERLAVERRCHTLKRHLDAIAEALHPHKPKSEYTELGMEDDLPAYQPDQLAGMVRELQEQKLKAERHAGSLFLEREEAREQLAAARADGERQWQPISTAPGLVVLVSRPKDKFVYTPTTAFRDATGVWRIYRSVGGNLPLSFEPTHWQPLPQPPIDQARANAKEEA